MSTRHAAAGDVAACIHTVEDVAIWHERMGMSPDEIVSSYPTITLSDVHAALAYYYENRSGLTPTSRKAGNSSKR